MKIADAVATFATVSDQQQDFLLPLDHYRYLPIFRCKHGDTEPTLCGDMDRSVFLEMIHER